MAENNSNNERELFLQISEGNEKAFRSLFHSYTKLVSAIIFRLTQAEEPIPDLVQEVFLKVWLSRDQLGAVENPRSWILQIVYNSTFNWMKRQKLQNRKYAEVAQNRSGLQHYFHDPAGIAEVRQMVSRAIQQLPDQARKVYVLNREEGLSIAEIAELLHLAPQTVKNTLGRAVAGVRAYLRRSGMTLFLSALLFFSSR